MSEERKKIIDAYNKVLDIYLGGFDCISQLLKRPTPITNEDNLK